MGVVPIMQRYRQDFLKGRSTQCVTPRVLTRLACQHLCHVLLKLTGGGGEGGGWGGGRREVQAYKIAPEVIKFHVTNYSILVSLLISQKLF